jgi:hypothetical protein
MKSFFEAPQRYRDAFGLVAEWAVTGAVVALPWSTSATIIFAVIGAVSILFGAAPGKFGMVCRSTFCLVPLALFGLALISVLWARTTWGEALHGLGPYIKLVFIPLLVFQFAKSRSPLRPPIAYLISCSVLLLGALLSREFPGIVEPLGFKYPGLPAKDYISQSHAFVLCAFSLLALVLFRRDGGFDRRSVGALCLAALFVFALLYVQNSRTALLSMVVLACVLGTARFGWRGLAVAFGGAALALSVAWFTSPYLRSRVEHLGWEYGQYEAADQLTSSGARLEFLEKGMTIIGRAPLLGSGSGATRAAFATLAHGEGASAAVTRNPHNELLLVTIELGVVGLAILLTMWAVHWRAFRASTGVASVGLVVVAQSAFSCLLNSHLHDFTQGWTYVLGVGVLGGLAISKQEDERNA